MSGRHEIRTLLCGSLSHRQMEDRGLQGSATEVAGSPELVEIAGASRDFLR